MNFLFIFTSIFIGRKIISQFITLRNDIGSKISQYEFKYLIIIMNILFILSILGEGEGLFLFHDFLSIPFLFIYLSILLIRLFIYFSLTKNNQNNERTNETSTYYKNQWDYFFYSLEYIVFPLLFHAVVTSILFALFTSVLYFIRVDYEENHSYFQH